VPYNNIAARHLGRYVRCMTTEANQLGLCQSSNLSFEYSSSVIRVKPTVYQYCDLEANASLLTVLSLLSLSSGAMRKLQ